MSFFFFQAEDGIRDPLVTGVQTCALPISRCGATSCWVQTQWVVCPLRSGSGATCQCATYSVPSLRWLTVSLTHGEPDSSQAAIDSYSDAAASGHCPRRRELPTSSSTGWPVSSQNARLAWTILGPLGSRLVVLITTASGTASSAPHRCWLCWVSASSATLCA